MRRIVVALVFGTPGFAGAYVGDGSFVDNGRSAAQHRYVLTLGPVEFNGTVRFEYSLADLPKTQFTIGLRPLSSTPAEAPVVRILLTNEKNQVVVDESGDLATWVRSEGGSSGPFIYRRGREKRIPLGDGAVQLEADEVKADRGWGTYFTPRRAGRYRLVVEAHAKAPTSYLLVATGGGWK